MEVLYVVFSLQTFNFLQTPPQSKGKTKWNSLQTKFGQLPSINAIS